MMKSIIERISQGKFWQFHGGIHPPEQKKLTSEKPIRNIALPKQLILPLQQHIGSQGELLVTVGDKILKGQPLTKSLNPMSVPVHAPTSGIISAIKKSVIAHPSGLSELCIFIDVDGNDSWIKREICNDFKTLDKETIINKIASAGIAGMGGAGFPTHIKLSAKPEINFLIINAAECEPYITADDLLIREQSEAIIDGIKILDHLLTPAFILIGIEDNKPEAIKALQEATRNIEKIKVCILPTKYPTGGEKQLIKVLTGKEIKSGSLPINSGIIVQNIATCFAITDAVIHDIPLIRRVVTVSGKSLGKPQNIWALLGTPISYLLKQCDHTHENNNKLVVVMGGPLMGFSISNAQVPIIKTSNCILAPSAIEMPSAFSGKSNEVECIRCGQCSDVCPSQLMPQELQWSAKAKDYDQLNKLNLFDCIDCGACAYVCPSQIPLVEYYRIAKAEIRQQQLFDVKSEKAKTRFEARKIRLEKDKTARIEKHKKAAEARKAAMNNSTPEANGAKSAVAAALARVKAKKAASNNQKKSISNKEQHESNDQNHESSLKSNDNRKAKISATIAKVKAKKAQEASISKEVELNDSVTSTLKITDDKKVRIAATIAKAKAKEKEIDNKEEKVTFKSSSKNNQQKEST